MSNVYDMTENSIADTDENAGKKILQEMFSPDPWAMRVCEDYVTVMRAELNKSDITKVDMRVEAWKKKNPIPDPAPSETQKRKNLLKHRLEMEVESYEYDIEGINNLIKAGADIFGFKKSLLEIAASENKLDVVEALYNSGLNNQNVNQAALTVAHSKGYTEIEAFLTKKSFDVYSWEPNQIRPQANQDIDSKNQLSDAVNDIAQKTLETGSSEEKSAMIQKIMQSPGEYNPRTLGKMSEALFHKFRDDEGIFWALAAELRADEDRAICPSTTPGIGIRHADQPAYGYYKGRDAKLVESKLKTVRKWDEKTPYNYKLPWLDSRVTCSPPEAREKIRVRRAWFRPENLRDPPPFEQENDSKMDDYLVLANNGDAKAQYALGNCYSHMICRPFAADIVAADAALAKQEKQKEMQPDLVIVGQRESMGNYHLQEDDRDKALFWYKKAAQQDYSDASALVIEYLLGSGKPSDIEEAKTMAVKMFKAAKPYAIDAMFYTTNDLSLKEDILIKNNRSVNYRAWKLVADRIPNVVSHLAASECKDDNRQRQGDILSCAELNANSESLAEQYINTYFPLYGSEKPTMPQTPAATPAASSQSP